MNQDTLKAIAKMIVPGSAVATPSKCDISKNVYWFVRARIPGLKRLRFIDDWLDLDSRKEAIQIAEELNRLSGLPAKRARRK